MTPTLTYLDDRSQKINEVVALMANDADVIEELTGLHDTVQSVAAERFSRYNAQWTFALNTIRDRSARPAEFSVESLNSQQNILQRIYAMVKRFFSFIAEQAVKVYQWAKEIYLRSKTRRDAIAKAVREDLKTLEGLKRKLKTNIGVTIQLEPAQVPFFVVNGAVPTRMSDAVLVLRDTMRAFRTSRGLAAALTVVRSVDDAAVGKVLKGNSENASFDALFGRVGRNNLRDAFETNWIPVNEPVTTRPKLMDDGSYTWGALLGDRMITQKTMGQERTASDDIDRFEIGYTLHEQLGKDLKVAPDNSVIGIDSIDDAITLAKEVLALLDECEQTARSIKEIEAVVKRAVQLKDAVSAFVPEDFTQAAPRVVTQYVRALNGLVKTTTAFQPALFAHAIRVAGTQKTVVAYATRQFSVG